MKVPINWLKEYVELPDSLEELTDKLTAIGHMQDHPPAQVGDDIVLDLEVRQNRSDCLSMIGIAREVAASLKTPLKFPDLSKIVLPKLATSPLVSIKDPQVCYRFNSLEIENITIAPSPAWLVQKIEAYGMKTINNLVDITNFVMIELNEPLHAFDRRYIQSPITVRLAKKGEVIEVLGGKKIKLTDADLVIADDQKILAMGGIIGCAQTGVSNETASIILEAATYNQAYIRRSSLRHNLRTEASLRHEKFLHPQLTEVALARAAQLIAKLCHGTVTKHHDAYAAVAKPVVINVSLHRLAELCGLKINMKDSLAIFQGLGIEAKKLDDDTIETMVPYFRTDLVQEEDLIEEVLRIHGYEKIVDTLPSSAPPVEITSKGYQFEEAMRDILVGYGFDEIITEPLVNEVVSAHAPVVLQNSLNAEKTMLRTTLKNGLLSALEYQRKLKREEVFLFEVGKIYIADGGMYSEQRMVACIIASEQASYLSTKGLAEAFCLRLERYFDPAIISIEKLKNNIWYFEINIDALLNQAVVTTYNIQTSLQQIIYQDLSLSIPEELEVGPILSAIKEVSPLLYKVSLGEIPMPLPKQRKSLFVKLQFNQADAQIKSKDIEPIRKQVIALIEKKYQGELR
jgi:phenylalanyl-tRNA synthetase beta chain